MNSIHPDRSFTACLTRKGREAITLAETKRVANVESSERQLPCKEVMVIILLPIPFVETNELRPVRAGLAHIYPIVTNTVSIPPRIGPALLSVIRMPVRFATLLSDFSNLLRQSRQVLDTIIKMRNLIHLLRLLFTFESKIEAEIR